MKEPMDIKRVVKEDYEQNYAHKFGNVDETNQSLERYNLQKLAQETDNLNRSILLNNLNQ